MKRLFVILTLAFALASVTNGALIGAAAATTVPISVTQQINAVCAVHEADQAQALHFKPCGKMRNGLAVLCHLDQGLIPAKATQIAVGSVVPSLRPTTPDTTQRQTQAVFRPPKINGVTGNSASSA